MHRRASYKQHEENADDTVDCGNGAIIATTANKEERQGASELEPVHPSTLIDLQNCNVMQRNETKSGGVWVATKYGKT